MHFLAANSTHQEHVVLCEPTRQEVSVEWTSRPNALGRGKLGGGNWPIARKIH